MSSSKEQTITRKKVKRDIVHGNGKDFSGRYKIRRNRVAQLLILCGKAAQVNALFTLFVRWSTKSENRSWKISVNSFVRAVLR